MVRFLNISAGQNPRASQPRKALLDIAVKSRITPWSRAIVQTQWRVGLQATTGGGCRTEADLPEGDVNFGMNLARDVYLKRVGQRLTALRLVTVFFRAHTLPFMNKSEGHRGGAASLRQHNLDQVR